MSRSGRIPITIPENTEVKIENNVIFAKGKLGELSYDFRSNAKVEIKENLIHVNKYSDSITHLKMWGTVRSRIKNIVEGVSMGFIRELELNGVGYKATSKGKILELLLTNCTLITSAGVVIVIASDAPAIIPKDNFCKLVTFPFLSLKLFFK